MQRFINRLIPFVMLGVAIVALTFGLFILAYLFMFGIMIGFILFIFNWIREKLSPPKKTPAKTQNKAGRVIDSDDWRVL